MCDRLSEIGKIHHSIETVQQMPFMGYAHQRGIIGFHIIKNNIEYPIRIFRIQVSGRFIGKNQGGIG